MLERKPTIRFSEADMKAQYIEFKKNYAAGHIGRLWNNAEIIDENERQRIKDFLTKNKSHFKNTEYQANLKDKLIGDESPFDENGNLKPWVTRYIDGDQKEIQKFFSGLLKEGRNLILDEKSNFRPFIIEKFKSFLGINVGDKGEGFKIPKKDIDIQINAAAMLMYANAMASAAHAQELKNAADMCLNILKKQNELIGGVFLGIETLKTNIKLNEENKNESEVVKNEKKYNDIAKKIIEIMQTFCDQDSLFRDPGTTFLLMKVANALHKIDHKSELYKKSIELLTNEIETAKKNNFDKDHQRRLDQIAGVLQSQARMDAEVLSKPSLTRIKEIQNRITLKAFESKNLDVEIQRKMSSINDAIENLSKLQGVKLDAESKYKNVAVAAEKLLIKLLDDKDVLNNLSISNIDSLKELYSIVVAILNEGPKVQYIASLKDKIKAICSMPLKDIPEYMELYSQISSLQVSPVIDSEVASLTVAEVKNTDHKAIIAEYIQQANNPEADVKDSLYKLKAASALVRIIDSEIYNDGVAVLKHLNEKIKSEDSKWVSGEKIVEHISLCYTSLADLSSATKFHDDVLDLEKREKLFKTRSSIVKSIEVALKEKNSREIALSRRLLATEVSLFENLSILCRTLNELGELKEIDQKSQGNIRALKEVNQQSQENHKDLKKVEPQPQTTKAKVYQKALELAHKFSDAADQNNESALLVIIARYIVAINKNKSDNVAVMAELNQLDPSIPKQKPEEKNSAADEEVILAAKLAAARLLLEEEDPSSIHSNNVRGEQQSDSRSIWRKSLDEVFDRTDATKKSRRFVCYFFNYPDDVDDEKLSRGEKTFRGVVKVLTVLVSPITLVWKVLTKPLELILKLGEKALLSRENPVARFFGHGFGIIGSLYRYATSLNPIQAYKECTERESRATKWFGSTGAKVLGACAALLSVAGMVVAAVLAGPAVVSAVGAINTSAGAAAAQALGTASGELGAMQTGVATAARVANVSVAGAGVFGAAVVIEAGVSSSATIAKSLEENQPDGQLPPPPPLEGEVVPVPAATPALVQVGDQAIGGQDLPEERVLREYKVGGPK